MAADESYFQFLMDVVNGAPSSVHIGQRLVEVREGYARVELEITPNHMQGKGQVHGGFYGFIADTAGFFATVSTLGSPRAATTIEYKVNLVASAKGGKLVAEGRVKKMGRSIAVTEMTVSDGEGTIYAIGLGTYKIFSES